MKAAKNVSAVKKSHKRSVEDKIIGKVLRAPALLTRDQVNDCEREAAHRDWVRRLTWYMLTETGKQCVEKMRHADRNTAVAFASLLGSFDGYCKNLNDIMSFVENAKMRTIVALSSREDFSAIMAQAKTERDAGNDPAFQKFLKQNGIEPPARI